MRSPQSYGPDATDRGCGPSAVWFEWFIGRRSGLNRKTLLLEPAWTRCRKGILKSYRRLHSQCKEIDAPSSAIAPASATLFKCPSGGARKAIPSRATTATTPRASVTRSACWRCAWMKAQPSVKTAASAAAGTREARGIGRRAEKEHPGDKPGCRDDLNTEYQIGCASPIWGRRRSRGRVHMQRHAQSAPYRRTTTSKIPHHLIRNWIKWRPKT